MRYPEDVLAPLADAAARTFLVERGLPAEPLLFLPYGPAEVRLVTAPDGRGWLCLAAIDPDELAVDVRTGEVVQLDGAGGTLAVNAGVAQFAACVEAFSARFPGSPSGPGDEGHERAAEAFRRVLLGLDPTALDDETGWWGSLLFDIAQGDYVDDDEDV